MAVKLQTPDMYSSGGGSAVYKLAADPLKQVNIDDGKTLQVLNNTAKSVSDGVNAVVSGVNKAADAISRGIVDGYNGIVNGAKGLAGNIADLLSKQGAPAGNYDPTSGAVQAAPIPEYLNADLAKYYGMDVTTAYQEALSNTSYQRAVADLKAAGLNPALVAGNVNGANGVAYPMLQGSGVSLSSGASSAKDIKALKAAFTAAGTVIGLVAGKSPTSGYIGGRLGGLLADMSASL